MQGDGCALFAPTGYSETDEREETGSRPLTNGRAAVMDAMTWGWFGQPLHGGGDDADMFSALESGYDGFTSQITSC